MNYILIAIIIVFYQMDSTSIIMTDCMNLSIHHIKNVPN